ncbi:MAG: replication protein [Firmicutes bacterium]|nr:replication protein [Bacillota bacterium]
MSETAITIIDTPEIETPANTKAQTWLCTLNNPKMTDEEFYDFLCKLESVKYFIFQRERGEETNTEHFQFYIEFEFARHFKTVKKVLPHGTHIEQRKGTKKQAREYCCKPETRIGNVHEHGVFIEERQRTDLHNIISAIKAGMTIHELRDDYEAQFFMFQKKFETERALYLDKTFGDVFRDINVSYIYGTTGTGKTRSIAERFGYRNIFRVTEYDQRAFDNYDGQDIIIFEEFRSSFKIAQMLNYLDGHPCRLPARFIDKTACYTKIFITTNIPLHKQYPNIQNEEPATFDAFVRRINNIYNYDNPTHRLLLENGEQNPLNISQTEMPF